MRRVLVPIFGLFLATTSFAQGTAKDVYDQLVKSFPRPAAEVSKEERAKLVEQRKATAKKTLEESAKILGEGEGLYYRAMIQQLAGEDAKAVIESFKACGAACPETSTGQDALFIAAQMLSSVNKDEAKKILATVKPEKLSANTKASYESFKRGLTADEDRDAMNGKAMPAIKPVKVLNAAADFDLSKCAGKVLVLDFWATWCPPCRAVVPEMVKLQEELGKDGVQVIGVTKYYGRGMDFAEDSKLPHGGKSVGGMGDKKMSEADEITTNEHFIKAFKVNYPIVFADGELAGAQFHVTGIPTVFVIDRSGNVLGSVVGGGDANHAKVMEMIKKAVGEKKAVN